MATTLRIPARTVEGATVGETLDKLKAPTHPIDELRAARRDLLAALQSRTTSALLRPGREDEPCGRDVLLRIAAWLHELAHLVPDLATYGYQRGEPCALGPDWSAWTAAQIAPQRMVRPEAAVARVVTAHARLLAALEGLDDAGLRRRGPHPLRLRDERLGSARGRGGPRAGIRRAPAGPLTPTGAQGRCASAAPYARRTC